MLTLGVCGRSGNPCEAEIQVACPDRPGAEMAKCLKDPSEHDTETQISSACTDFIALNTACSEDIRKFCDDAFFSADLTLCLTEWTPERDLSRKCASVVKWAIPQKNQEGDDDYESGLSGQEQKEKADWHAKRRAGRSAAVEKIREDRKADQELADLKKEDPVAYAQLLKEREEAKRSLEELKRRKRLMAAAEDRKRREEEGEEDGDPEEKEKEQRRNERREARRAALKKTKTNWLPYVLGGLAVAFVFFNVVNFFTSGKKKDDEKKK